MFIACLALISVYPSYSSCMLRPDDLGKDIGSLCFRTCLSILPVHSKSGGPGGAKVVDKDTATLSKYFAQSFTAQDKLYDSLSDFLTPNNT